MAAPALQIYGRRRNHPIQAPQIHQDTTTVPEHTRDHLQAHQPTPPFSNQTLDIILDQTCFAGHSSRTGPLHQVLRQPRRNRNLPHVVKSPKKTNAPSVALSFLPKGKTAMTQHVSSTLRIALLSTPLLPHHPLPTKLLRAYPANAPEV